MAQQQQDIADRNESTTPSKPENTSKTSKKYRFKFVDKILSSRKQRNYKSTPKLKQSMIVITPSIYQNFQTFNINIVPSPQIGGRSPSSPSTDISRSTSISIGIYELPSIKSFGYEYKFAPYYYFGYGFYGNPYDKNSKECNQKPIKCVNKVVHIYDKLAISLNKDKNEILIWRNGQLDSEHNQISIDNKKDYQFIIESQDIHYNIKLLK